MDREKELTAACTEFLRKLDAANLVDHPDLFSKLAEVAQRKRFGYVLEAHQRGILGTYLRFVKEG